MRHARNDVFLANLGAYLWAVSLTTPEALMSLLGYALLCVFGLVGYASLVAGIDPDKIEPSEPSEPEISEEVVSQ